MNFSVHRMAMVAALAVACLVASACAVKMPGDATGVETDQIADAASTNPLINGEGDQAVDDVTVAENEQAPAPVPSSTPSQQDPVPSSDELKIITTKLYPCTQGAAYTFLLHGVGGSNEFIWSAVGFPSGLAINESRIEGTTNEVGTFDVLITMQDKADSTLSVSAMFKLEVLDDQKSGSSTGEKFNVSTGPDFETKSCGSESPLKIKYIVKDYDPSKPVINVFNQGTMPLQLMARAEGGSGTYTYKLVSDKDGLPPEMIPVTEWEYDVAELFCKGTKDFCPVLSNIKPKLVNAAYDPVETVFMTVTDSCGATASLPVTLVSRYPEDSVKGMKLCMHVQHIDHADDNLFLAFALRDGLTEEPGTKDVIPGWVGYWKLGDRHQDRLVGREWEMSVGESAQLATMTGDEIQQLNAKTVSDSPENASPRLTMDLMNKRGDIDIIWVKIYTKNWYILFFDDAHGDLINDDEELGWRDLLYGIETRNVNGGIWVRRPREIDNGCNLPQPSYGAVDEMRDQAAEGADASNFEPSSEPSNPAGQQVDTME